MELVRWMALTARDTRVDYIYRGGQRARKEESLLPSDEMINRLLEVVVPNLQRVQRLGSREPHADDRLDIRDVVRLRKIHRKSQQ